MKQRKCFSLLLALVLTVGFLTVPAAAAEVPCESAVATGSYRHPVTGIIEDSGGESSEALGQSMVTSMVDSHALVETAADGQLYLSLRFNLMSNVSKTDFSVQTPADTQWTSVSYEVTAQGEDTLDLRLPVPSKDAIVRAQCFVDAMGRAVVFYVNCSTFSDGNAGDFVRMDESHAVPTEAPGATEPQGLVIGGGNAPTKPAESDADGARQILISGRIWGTLFVLVFCAQLLALLVFWGLKTLICGGDKPARRHRKLPPPEMPDEDPEFSEEDWDADWEESADESR